ncbi:MAG: sugar phosphate isomerase/epimerase family protein [Candidatus Marisimplicoccus sp.]|jgi:sugar phosphate isomerase/epimerase|tara:strand:- start:4152 stop:5051 length:900 start_codon:yes stop_codon:yes gene_type:complete
MNSRRSFIKKSSLITLGAFNLNFSPLYKDINGVDISVVTYSFNPGIEDMNIIIQNCLDSGSDNLELMGNHVETTMGMPRSKRSHAEWRSNVSMKDFKNVKKQFKNQGINIFAYKPYCMGPNNSDGEIEYAMKATKALGADYLTAELTTKENTKRISQFAEKHNVNIGYHAHLQASDTAWDFALNNSKKNFINLDVGHYIAARKENTKETLLNFILKNHSRICSLHLKDRQAAKPLNLGASDNQIWGKGDTPIIEILQLVRDNSFKFTSSVELEYRIPDGSNRVDEVIRCYEYCNQALNS